jgi:N-acetylmuramoyl-L-alanine amidase
VSFAVKLFFCLPSDSVRKQDTRRWSCARALAALLCCAGIGTPFAASIAIDVGHYLERPGVISARGVSEFEYNRTLAIEIAQALERARHRVVLIGADGLARELGRRAPRANGMDLLISVHHDSVRPRFISLWEYDGIERKYSDLFSGFSLFVSRLNPEVEKSLRCASAAGAALRRAGFTPSRYHADPVLGEGRPFADEENGVHYFDNLAVLRTASVPALLFEAGVIVHREEEMRMRDAAVRARIAAGIVEAVASCVHERPRGRKGQ